MPEQTAKFCIGCGYPVVLATLARIAKSNGLLESTALGLDIGCSLLAWNYLPVSTFQTHHGRVVPVMVGFKRARKNSLSIALTGDGGAYSIGLQSLIHAARRDEPISVLVVNNMMYSMTGGQTAPTTITGYATETDPGGSVLKPIHGPEFLRAIANDQAFLARTAVNEITGLPAALEKAFATQKAGHFSLVEILSYCPINWKTKGVETNNFLETKLKPEFPVGNF